MISSFTNVLLRVVNAIRITFSLIFPSKVLKQSRTVKFLNIQPRFNKTYFYFRLSEPVSPMYLLFDNKAPVDREVKH